MYQRDGELTLKLFWRLKAKRIMDDLGKLSLAELIELMHQVGNEIESRLLLIEGE